MSSGPASSDARDAQTAWAATLFAALRGCGVRHVVASPGSRNTPLVWAAHRTQGLELHTVVDERSAAFFALGQARATGVPSVLVCTSGTAAGHYLPAVIEAAQSSLPLIVLSADRPPELQDCAAPQTVPQARLFGDFVRWFNDVGVPESEPSRQRALIRKVCQAVDTSLRPHPGPVHLNVPLRKPLEPAPRAAIIDLPPLTLPERRTAAPDPTALEQVLHASRRFERGVITCGPSLPDLAPDPTALAELSRRTGFPVLAELTSQQLAGHPSARVLGAFDLFARQRSWRDALRPDYVLQLGMPPTSAAWSDALAAADGVTLHVVAPQGWPDPHGRADLVVRADVAPFVAEAAALAPKRTDDAWFQQYSEHERAARSRAHALTVDAPDTEAAAVASLLATLPETSNLFVGNSLPIRDVDWFLPATTSRFRTYFQRGGNGIDGLIAGALGIGSASARPTVALVGDVSFLHDAGSLALAKTRSETVVVVVLANGGGRIFEQLPLAAQVAAADMTPWLTPHDVSAAAVARGYGLNALQVAGEDLARSLRTALAHPGVHVLEVAVTPTPVGWFQQLRDS